MKKDIVVVPAKGPIEGPIVLQGGEEPMFDEESRQLIILGREGTYIRFNWDNVLYYGVSPADDSGEPAHV